ncbi:MAG: heme ABC exporter ATP-binding protein CcmA [Gemmatimonadales bacterium]
MPSAEPPLLAGRGLQRRFGALRVLRGLDVTVEAGQVLVVLGENGSGKSTLLRLLAGLTRPTAGSVAIQGVLLRSSDPAIRRLYGLVAHQSTLYDDLTVAENLRFAARLHGLADPAGAARRAMVETEIAHRAEDRAGRLSRGLLQRASIARAFIHQPRLMLLDEPFTALDVPSAAHIRAWLARRVDQGAGAVVVTHQVAEIWDQATHVGVIVRGQWAVLEPRPVSMAGFQERYREVISA